MFTGKGGVGKTTCSAATALQLSASGPTLALSTDATPSLSHIFVAPKSRKHAEVRPSLFISEISEAEIRQMWDDKFGRDVYGVFSAFVDISYEEFVEFMTSVLPGLGEEFMVDHIREQSLAGAYENIVWDTAPLGQTLALLSTPALLGKHLKMAPRIYSKLKVGRSRREPVLDILKHWEVLSAKNMDFLRNSVYFNMVTIPEALAVEQLEAAFQEFSRFGLAVKSIVINNVVSEPDSDFLLTKAKQQEDYLEHIRDRYSHLNITELPMFPREVKGTERLREVGNLLYL